MQQATKNIESTVGLTAAQRSMLTALISTFGPVWNLDIAEKSVNRRVI